MGALQAGDVRAEYILSSSHTPEEPLSRIRKAHKSGRKSRALLVVACISGLIFATAGAALAFAAATLASYEQDLPRLRTGDLRRADQTTKLYSSDGYLLTSLHAEENRVVLPLSRIPRQTQQAIVDIEDERFRLHHGVDLEAVARAIRVNLASGAVVEGGSTIDQQYVRIILGSREKTLRRKIREALLAYRLERILTKEEILSRYLNTVYFGQGAYGVEAAAMTYFRKHAPKLTLAESALLAGLIRSPNRLSPRARRDAVLRKMFALRHITKAQLDGGLRQPIHVFEPRPATSAAPYFTEHVRKILIDRYGADAVFKGGLRVRTTLSLKMQRAADSAWRSVLGGHADPSVAIVAVDPRNGHIKAMAGGRSFAAAKYNLATQAHRQPGSAFKTFVLAAALEEGVPPEKRYESAPALIELPEGGTWNVSNATEGSGGGLMTVRDATVHSVNAVFARLVMDIGAEKVATTAADVGIVTPTGENPAIALGGLRRGVTPLDMASAYGTFANHGVWMEPMAIGKVTDSSGRLVEAEQPVSSAGVTARTARLVTDILQQVIERGTGTGADIGRPAAGKTGTTQTYRDAWFVGYVPSLAASVWVGYPRRQRSMADVHGIAVKGGTFPAMIWARFMRKALAGVRPVPFAKPGVGLVRAKVCTESDFLATRRCPDTVFAQFARGTQPTTRCRIH